MLTPLIAALRRAGRDRARRAVALLLLLVGSLAAGMACATGIEFTRAQFAESDQGPWVGVTLPDTWAARGLKAPGRGVYRVSFMLDEVPTAMWALRVRRLSGKHQLRVNGMLVDDTMQPASVVVPRPVLTMISVPPAVLQVGENSIELVVENGPRPGLSTMTLGASDALGADFARDYLAEVTLPQMLNLAGAGVSLFMLLLWWRRRSEAALGAFGVLGIIASLRNYGYYNVAYPLPAPLIDWLYFAAQVSTTSLLCLFATALAKRRLRGFVPLVLGASGLMLLGGIAATLAGRFALVRAVAYPLLLVMLLPSLWLLGQRVRELRAAALAAMLIGLAMVFVAGVHDYLLLQGHASVMGFYWQPYAMPVALTGFGGFMLQRVIGALQQVEELNQTLEQRVQDRTRALEEANAAKTRFIAAASHDLRQPVVTIGLLVGLLREQIATPSLRHMMDRVNEAVASLEALLKGLLDLSRFESGTVRPRLQAVSLQPLFDAIAAHEGEAARLKGLHLRFRATGIAVHSDPMLLEQILRNLVSNAVRYTDRGGVLVGLRRRGAGRVLLQVWDTGRGIPKEQQEAAFQEFAQLGPRRDRVRGLGLGLALVKRASLLLGHPLHLSSVSQRGSCFSIELPTAVALATVEAPPARLDRPLAGLRVLLVEDEAPVREAMSLQMQRWGATVRAFDSLHSLERALRDIDPAQPWAELLVTDNRLPDADSVRVIELTRRHCGPVPALVVTGDTSPRDLSRLTDNAVPVLHKPFRADELLAAMESACRPPDRAGMVQA